MDLFEHRLSRDKSWAPLAERMRPRSLDEIVGQRELLAPGRFFARALTSDRLPSMILWGPPGSGKTTLAQLIAQHTKAEFVPFSAVLGGVKEIREIVALAQRRLAELSRRTVLFVDEIHRFNKSQQDAFLPHVERGIITLVGATTENPSFSLNHALLSRCRVLVLQSLGEEELLELLRRALHEPKRGLGQLGLELDDAVLRRIARSADGDARAALNLLESAALYVQETQSETLAEGDWDSFLENHTVRYDREGEEHYNVVSALIKSMRGSDPDAAIYWMTRMLEGGEDPLFILRRIVIFAAEDVSNADPQALGVAISALQAFQAVGLPEGVLPMAQAVTYLACAPKSNSAMMAYLRARKAVQEHGALPVPAHIRNAPTSLLKQLGYGRNYKYPHNFSGHYVRDEYLPEALRGARFYRPSANGFEAEIAGRLDGLRATPEPEDDLPSKTKPS
ncbi:MAG: replication-associated recombination protein A [Myxococcales bacterium]|nr:replication-associated recombination protein A [Myxococcales bacterium]